jgi:hypothetical protein
MAMQGPHPEYLPARVYDYGTLVDMTAALHPLFGTAVPNDLSFSSSTAGSQLPGGGGGSMPQQAAAGGGPDALAGTPGHDVGGVVAAPQGGAGGNTVGDVGGGAAPGAGGGAPGGGSGGASEALPFTGFAAGTMGALGGAFAALGGALRNVLRRDGGY